MSRRLVYYQRARGVPTLAYSAARRAGRLAGWAWWLFWLAVCAGGVWLLACSK